MLSTVLHSDTAVDMSPCIMDTFVEMHYFIASNVVMFEQIRMVKLRQLEYQKTADKYFKYVFDYIEVHKTLNQRIFFERRVYDAFELLVSLAQKAKRKVILIDVHMGAETLNIFTKKESDASVTV